MKFERPRLETCPAPPLFKVPRPFNPSVSKIGLAKMLLQEVIEGGIELRHKELRKALLSRPCIYGVFGSKVGGFHPIREKCTGCLRCVQEYPDICKVDRNPEFFTLGDSYWIPDTEFTSTTPLSTVWYEAETGKIPVKGMGYKGSFAGSGWDSMWTDMSEIVRPTRDGVYGREFISTVVDLGRKPRFIERQGGSSREEARITTIPFPVIFDLLPPSLSNASIRTAVAEASKRLGTFHIASLDDEHYGGGREPLPRNLIPLVTLQDLEQHQETLESATVIECQYDEGLSSSRIRESIKKPILAARIPLNGAAEETTSKLANEGFDIIHICADYHGREYEPRNPRHLVDAIRAVHTRLVKESIRDEVTLIGSGGIILAEHIPKAIICGLDAIAIDTTVPVALQAKFEGECVSPEKGRIKPYEFDAAWGSQRLANLLASWHDQLIEVLSAMGIRDVRRLRGDVGRAMFNEELEREAFGDIQRLA
jgi:hypothetical protein